MFDVLTPTVAGLLMLAGGIPPLLAVYWLRNDRQQPAVRWFQYAMLSGMIWSVSFGLIALVDVPQLRFVLTNLLILAMGGASISYFIFSYEFVFKKQVPKAVFVLFVPAVVFFVLAWSNPGNLIYTMDNPQLTDEILIPANEGSIRPLVNVVLNYGLVVMAAGMVLGELLSATDRRRQLQASVILFSIATVSVLGAIKVLDVLPPYFDPTPIGWTLSGLLFVAAISRHQFLQYAPAPRAYIMSHIPAVVIVFNSEGIVVDHNETARELFSIAVGMTHQELTAANSALAGVIGDTETATLELQIDDSIRFFDTQSSPLEYGRGAEGTIMILRDITHRTEAQQELEATKERYRRLYQQSSDYVVLVDEDETVIDTTQGIENVLGYAPTEAIGRTMLEYVHPEDEKRLTEAYAEVVSDPTLELNIEFRARTADGRYCWLEARGSNQLADPLLGGVLVNVREITARKQAEQAIAETKEYYRRVLEQSLDYTLVIDDSDTITDVTPGVEDMSGFSPEEVVGQNAFEAVHPDERNRVRESFRSAIRNPDIVINTEYRVQLRDGSYHWVEARGRSHLDDPLLDGLILNVRDISERKQREQELAETTARLHQKNEQLERLAQIISHDLKTPLSTAQKLTRLLRVDLDDLEPSVEQLLGDLEATHDRIRAFADHLPRLARESTDVDERTNCELRAVAEAAWSVVDTGSLSLQIDSNRTLSADPTRLQQVFENLFQNTVTHGVAAVDSDSQRNAATTVRVGTTDGGFYIEDDGPGIKPEQCEELFEYGMSTGSGSGFGLAIVRTSIEAHGWTVELVEPTVSGVRFEITTDS